MENNSQSFQVHEEVRRGLAMPGSCATAACTCEARRAYGGVRYPLGR